MSFSKAIIAALLVCAVSVECYDYFLLAIQWGPSFCLVTNCLPPSNIRKWTIHGLWPTTPSPPYPAYCNDIPFREADLRSIESQLIQEWPTLTSPGDHSSFWEYEWDKHGTCGVDNSRVNTQFNYFNYTLNLHYSAEVQNNLQDNSILPSDSKTYTRTTVSNAFRNAWGVTPELVCNTVSGRSYLAEVRICYNKNFGFMNCPNVGSCPTSNIYYPYSY